MGATRLDGRVLAVGRVGIDGSSGIPTDIKTLTALGAHAMTAITAIGTHGLPAMLVIEQISHVLAETGADCLKIGALDDAAMVAAVAELLDGEARGLPLVLEASAAAAPLLRHARLVVGAEPVVGARVALIVSEQGDVLTDGASRSNFPVRRAPGRPVEGIVPALAAAISAGLAQRLPLAAAVRRGRDFVQEAMLTAPDFGRVARPLNLAHTVRPFPSDSTA